MAITCAQDFKSCLESSCGSRCLAEQQEHKRGDHPRHSWVMLLLWHSSSCREGAWGHDSWQCRSGWYHDICKRLLPRVLQLPRALQLLSPTARVPKGHAVGVRCLALLRDIPSCTGKLGAPQWHMAQEEGVFYNFPQENEKERSRNVSASVPAAAVKIHPWFGISPCARGDGVSLV